MGTLGSFTFLFLTPPIDPNNDSPGKIYHASREAQSFKQDITDTINMMVDKRMLKFTPFMIGDALTKNVIAGLFVPMMVLTLESQTHLSN